MRVLPERHAKGCHLLLVDAPDDAPEVPQNILDELEEMASHDIGVRDFVTLLGSPDRFEPAWSREDAAVALEGEGGDELVEKAGGDAGKIPAGSATGTGGGGRYVRQWDVYYQSALAAAAAARELPAVFAGGSLNRWRAAVAIALQWRVASFSWFYLPKTGD